MEERYECLKLDNQLCFKLYACSKEVIRCYKPVLDEVDLTYTQYITMLILWEHKNMNVKEIGKYMYLDPGTLTPVLKKLEEKGFVSRNRLKSDERITMISVTDKGYELREKVTGIPCYMKEKVNLDDKEMIRLYEILSKLLSTMQLIIR